MSDFEDFLVCAFPTATWRATVIGVSEGVALADDLRASTHWLGSLVGRDLLGSLRRAGVMWRIRQLCALGDLPFKCEEVTNTARNAHLVRIDSGQVRAHITRTDSEAAFPTDMPIRQDHRLTYNADLFRDYKDGKVVPISEVLKTIPQVYAWLTFGADRQGRLSHVCWASPAAEEDVWMGRINILRRASDLGATAIEPDPVPRPDPMQKTKFRQHVEEMLDKTAKEEPQGDA